MPFLLALLILNFSFHHLKSKDCLSINSFSNENCTFCGYKFFNDELYTENFQNFDLQSCLTKISLPYERFVYITNRTNQIVSNHSGSLEDPYDDLMTAFLNESLIAAQYSSGTLTFNLLGDIHYLINTENLPENPQIFRRIFLDIIIKPLYCEENSIEGCLISKDEKVTIIVKTAAFGFYISKSLNLQNLLFIANDLSLNTKNNSLCCLDKSKICCLPIDLSNETSPCSLISQNIYDNSIYVEKSFLNLDMIIDNPDFIFPEIFITNSVFNSFYSVKNDYQFNSFISFLNGFPGSFSMNNSEINGFFLKEGIFSQQNSLSSIYIITENGTYLFDLKNIYSLNSQILLENLQINNFNLYNASVISNGVSMSIYMIYLDNFQGSIIFINISFVSNLNFFSMITIVSSSLTTLQLSNNTYFRNMGNYIFEFSSNSQESLISNSNFMNNSVQSLISVTSNTLIFSNNLIINSTIPQNNIIQFKSSKITIIQCSFINIWTTTKNYYILVSLTEIDETIDFQMQFPDIPNPPYAEDAVYIQNSTFMNTNLNLFLNYYSIILMEISQCIFKNIVSFDGIPFISVQTEQYMKMENISVENFQSNYKFLYLSYTRNISFEHFWLSNSTFFYFCDIYSMTNIDESANATKSWLEISNSYFHNVSLKSYNGQSTNFFFVNYYTLYHGFFMMFISNSYFHSIFNNVFNDDCLFYFAAAHNTISNSSFLELANMTLFKIFVRVSDSNVTITDSQFKITKYAFARFYYVSITYKVHQLIIKNTIFQGNYPILYPYSMEFLKVQNLYFSNITIRDITSLTGAAIRIYMISLRNFLIENSHFFNNPGASNNGANLIIQVTNSEGFDWINFDINLNNYSFGIINCYFNNTRISGSITVLDQTEFLIANSSFINIKGENGAIINAGSQTNILILNVNINNSYSSGLGGCFAIRQSILVIRESWIYNTSAQESGGILVATKNSVIYIINSFFDQSFSVEGGMLSTEDTNLTIENSTFTNSKSTFQGGFFYLRKSQLIIKKVNIIGGEGLTGAAIHGELITINFQDFLMKNCFSSMDKGLGNLFLNGVYGINNTIDRFICTGNKAMSGACIYAIDIIISLTNSQISYNTASQENIIGIFQASEYTELDVLNIELINNIVTMTIIQSDFGQLNLQKSLFMNNSIQSNLIFAKNSEIILESLIIFLDKIYNLIPNGYLIDIENSQTIVIENTYIYGGYQYGLINLDSCDNVQILSSFLFEGNGINGGALSSKDNVLTVINTNFSKNCATLVGGAIFINGAPNTTLINNSFSMNYAIVSGSDVHLEDPTHSDLTYCVLVMTDSIFLKSLISSVVINYLDKVYWMNNSFQGLGVEIPNQAFSISNTGEIQIMDSFFANYGVYGIGYFESFLNDCLVQIDSCNFVNGSSNSSGGLLYFVGDFEASLVNCSFLNGISFENGGGLAFYCGIICSLTFLNLNKFINNSAQVLGGAIYSSKTYFDISDSNIFFDKNSAPLGNNTFTFPAKIISLKNVDENALENYINNNSFTQLNNSVNQSMLITKSGYNINLGIFITDHFNNLIKYDSDSIFSLKILGINASKITIENNIVKLNQGLAIFNQIALITDPGEYDLLITSESTEELNETIKIILNPCGRGDIVDGKRCIQCSEGFYSLEENPQKIYALVGSFECEKCPANSNCPGGDKIIPYEGYWRFDENSTLIIQCLEVSACPYQAAYETMDQIKFSFECGKGYWGNLCLNCEKGYGKGYNGCFDCNADNYFLMFSFQYLFLVFMSILEAYLAVQMKAKSSSKTLIKIFFYHNSFVMTITTMSSSSSDEMKELFSLVNDKLTLIPSNIYNFYCFIYGMYEREQFFEVNLSIQLMTPIINAIILTMIKILTDLIYRYFKKKKIQWLKMLKMNFLILFLISYRNWYPRVILHTILLFQCVDLGPDMYVSEDPNILCYQEKHKELMIFLSLPSILVWSIGIPLITFYFMRNQTKKIILVEENGKILELVLKEEIESKNKKKSKRVGAIYFSLISDYKEKYLYWQIVEFFILTICLFMSQIAYFFGDFLRRIFLFLMYGIFFLIYLKLEPYRDIMNTSLMCLSFIICIFTLIFEIIGSNEENDYIMRVFAKNFILVINVIFYLSFLVAITKRWIDENKNIIVEIGNKLSRYSQIFSKSKNK